MNSSFKNYIAKVSSAISNNPFNKIIDFFKNYNKISKLTENDLKQSMPLSFKVVMDFKNNFKKAAITDMRNLDKKVARVTGESVESELIYNEKFEIGTFIKLLPLIFYSFAFILFFGEERFVKMQKKLYDFLDRTIGEYIDDPEIREMNKKKED